MRYSVDKAGPDPSGWKDVFARECVLDCGENRFDTADSQ